MTLYERLHGVLMDVSGALEPWATDEDRNLMLRNAEQNLLAIMLGLDDVPTSVELLDRQRETWGEREKREADEDGAWDAANLAEAPDAA